MLRIRFWPMTANPMRAMSALKGERNQRCWQLQKQTNNSYGRDQKKVFRRNFFTPISTHSFQAPEHVMHHTVKKINSYDLPSQLKRSQTTFLCVLSSYTSILPPGKSMNILAINRRHCVKLPGRVPGIWFLHPWQKPWRILPPPHLASCGSLRTLKTSW